MELAIVAILREMEKKKREKKGEKGKENRIFFIIKRGEIENSEIKIIFSIKK